ncbi:hypothetical protein BDZ89DRAFT_1196189 [Hymenopellis radicata]|nr:hypothetical protein BDZ89DRAFT_1196189 [Hymenopellis radicata]
MLPNIDAANLPAANGAWVGKRQWFRPVKRDLQSVKDAGIQVIPWEGWTTHPLLDKHSRMFALMVARPRKSNWLTLIRDAARRIAKGCKHARFSQKQLIHSRGDFPVMATGIIHSGGTEEPCNAANSKCNQAVMDHILGSPEFCRIQEHNDRIFRLHNPALYKVYDEVLSFVVDSDEGLRRTYTKSPFAATTINFGPQTVLDDHTDSHNLPWGWCRVTPMGPFDHRRGGHLVLWDLGIAIEFPAGASIFIPSALLVHSNVTIQPGESRYSVTSYSAGGLFRWAWNGGRTDEECDLEFGKEEGKRRRAEHAKTAWKEALTYFPIWKPFT